MTATCYHIGKGLHIIATCYISVITNVWGEIVFESTSTPYGKLFYHYSKCVTSVTAYFSNLFYHIATDSQPVALHVYIHIWLHVYIHICITRIYTYLIYTYYVYIYIFALHVYIHILYIHITCIYTYLHYMYIYIFYVYILHVYIHICITCTYTYFIYTYYMYMYIFALHVYTHILNIHITCIYTCLHYMYIYIFFTCIYTYLLHYMYIYIHLYLTYSILQEALSFLPPEESNIHIHIYIRKVRSLKSSQREPNMYIYKFEFSGSSTCCQTQGSTIAPHKSERYV